MKFTTKIVAAIAAASTLTVPTGAGATTATHEAEQVRKLDIMLMVTSLRCRFGADNFQANYRQFTTRHIDALNAAGRTLEADLAKRHGTKGAKRALDRINVGMANEYGQGHPWLECGELKTAASELAATEDSAQLALAAEELLGPRPIAGGRFASR